MNTQPYKTKARLHKTSKSIAQLACATALSTTVMISSTNAQITDSQGKPGNADSEFTIDRGSENARAPSAITRKPGTADKVQFIVKDAPTAEAGVVQIKRGTSEDSIDAEISNAVLSELALAIEDALGIAVEFDDPTLAAEPVADVRFSNETHESAIGQLFRGFSHISYVPPGKSQRVIKIYSVAQDTPTAPTAQTLPVRSATAVREPYANLDALRSLKDYEDDVERFSVGADGEPFGAYPGEGDDEVLLAEQEQAKMALREARKRRALDALALESGTRIKADAISELADSDVDDAKVTDALLGAVEDTSLAPPVRQHALETLINRGAENGYADVPIVELLEAYSEDETAAVSLTARHSLAGVRRLLAKSTNDQATETSRE